jgi:ABC-2 type transport system ATP-binding protein
VEVQNLSRFFGSIRAVDDISFQVSRGDVLGFLGPNGAGKSTTMKMITGFLTPSAGTARVCGADPTEEPLAVKSRIGYLPENAPLYDDMEVLAFLNFILDVRGTDAALRKASLDRAVHLTGISSVLSQRIETLSKGFRRRVGLAQAIIHDPDVLILDEPTDGLDPNQKYEVRSLIRSMAAEKAIILSTHILEEVNAVCNRAIIISRGKVVADSTPDVLRKKSALCGRVKILLGQKLIDAEMKELASLPGVGGVTAEVMPSGEVMYSIQPNADHDIAAFLLQEFDRRRWKIQGFSVDAGELDDVFRSMTRSEVA